MHTRIPIHKHASQHTRISTRIHKHASQHTHTHTHTDTPQNTHTHTHTQTHTPPNTCAHTHIDRNTSSSLWRGTSAVNSFFAHKPVMWSILFTIEYFFSEFFQSAAAHFSFRLLAVGSFLHHVFLSFFSMV